jgi:hypothetical protein
VSLLTCRCIDCHYAWNKRTLIKHGIAGNVRTYGRGQCTVQLENIRGVTGQSLVAAQGNVALKHPSYELSVFILNISLLIYILFADFSCYYFQLSFFSLIIR